MRVTVTPLCDHREARLRDPAYRPVDETERNHFSHGAPLVGRHAVVSRDGVWLDGKPVLRRDRRAKVDRIPGHPWVISNGHPDPRYQRIGWTSFRIEVEP